MLPHLPTPLRASRVRSLMAEARFARDLRMLGVVASTQDVARHVLRREAPDGTVIVAEAQTEGRGRRGSRWHCPHGTGLLFSAILRPLPPASRQPFLSLALGLAVCQSLRKRGLPAGIKWPNDILIGEEKVAGCLVELAGAGGILGVGLNANGTAEELPREAPLPATSLRLLLGRPVDREHHLAAILDELALVQTLLEAGRTAELLKKFETLDLLTGRQVAIRAGDRLLKGTVAAIHPVEGLSLCPEAGPPITLAASHCHILALGPPRNS